MKLSRTDKAARRLDLAATFRHAGAGRLVWLLGVVGMLALLGAGFVRGEWRSVLSNGNFL